MFDNYQMATVTWTAVPRAELDATVSTDSRVFTDGADFCKVKLLPLYTEVPETAVFQISTTQCDATGKALTEPTTGAIKMTSARRITANRVNASITVEAQLDDFVKGELENYGLLLDAITQQAATIAAWGG